MGMLPPPTSRRVIEAHAEGDVEGFRQGVIAERAVVQPACGDLAAKLTVSAGRQPPAWRVGALQVGDAELGIPRTVM